MITSRSSAIVSALTRGQRIDGLAYLDAGDAERLASRACRAKHPALLSLFSFAQQPYAGYAMRGMRSDARRWAPMAVDRRYVLAGADAPAALAPLVGAQVFDGNGLVSPPMTLSFQEAGLAKVQPHCQSIAALLDSGEVSRVATAAVYTFRNQRAIPWTEFRCSSEPRACSVVWGLTNRGATGGTCAGFRFAFT